MSATKSNREAIGARLRYDVLRRCNFACFYCGSPAALGIKQLHVDHVIPVSHGGTNDPWNLVAACWDCNAGKANTLPNPQTVKAVFDDYMADVERHGGEIYSCRFCNTPFYFDDDLGYRDQCENCANARMDAWSMAWGAGYHFARGITSAGGEL